MANKSPSRPARATSPKAPAKKRRSPKAVPTSAAVPVAEPTIAQPETSPALPARSPLPPEKIAPVRKELKRLAARLQKLLPQVESIREAESNSSPSPTPSENPAKPQE